MQVHDKGVPDVVGVKVDQDVVDDFDRGVDELLGAHCEDRPVIAVGWGW